MFYFSITECVTQPNLQYVSTQSGVNTQVSSNIESNLGLVVQISATLIYPIFVIPFMIL